MLLNIICIAIIIILLILNLSIIWGVVGFFYGAGSGAPFIPSGNAMVEEMIQIAGNLQNKKIYDLGCGDGRIVFAAEKKGANAIGIEIAYPVYTIARIRKWIKKSHATFKNKSLWNEDLSKADVIFLYLLPPMMKRFAEEKVPTLHSGTKIISHGFELPGHTPEYVKTFGPGKRILRYIV